MSRTFTTELPEAWTDVAGRRVRSLSTGHPSGLPEVVLLPGLGTVSYAEPWLAELGRWTRATLLDLPGWRGGRGHSSPPSVEGVADAAAGWLRATDLRGVVLVGHSSGAQSALRTALSEPERLAGLVLAGPTLVPAARRPAGLLVRLAATLVREQWSEVPAVLPWYARGGLDWLRLVRSVIADEPEAVAGALRVPTHLMTGAQDRIAPPEWAQQLAELCSGSYETLPDAHNNCFTAPAAASAAVRRAVRAWAGAVEPSVPLTPVVQPAAGELSGDPPRSARAVGDRRPDWLLSCRATRERGRVADEPSVTKLLTEIRNELRMARTIPSTGLVLRHRAVDQGVEYILSDSRFDDLQVTPDNPSTIDAALKAVTVDGMVAEFGVYKGTSLTRIAKFFTDRTVHGFDSFIGLPDAWGAKPAGAFHVGAKPPEVPVDNVEFHVGWFDDTVPVFAGQHSGPFAFAHLDADLYSSTKTVFDHLGDWFVPGTVVVFDEYFGYHGWQIHEHKAFHEFLDRTGLSFAAISLGHMNLAVRLLDG